MNNPEQKLTNESNKSNSTPFSLPQIQKTSNLKKAKEEYNRLMYDQSNKVLPVYGSLVWVLNILYFENEAK